MKKKSLNFIVPLVVYPFDVMVSIGEEDAILEKKLKSSGVDVGTVELVHSETARGRCILFGGNRTLVRIYKYPDKPVDYGYLQHEIFHAVEFIFDRIGMKLTTDSDEAYAYLIAYLTTKIHERL